MPRHPPCALKHLHTPKTFASKDTRYQATTNQEIITTTTHHQNNQPHHPKTTTPIPQRCIVRCSRPLCSSQETTRRSNPTSTHQTPPPQATSRPAGDNTPHRPTPPPTPATGMDTRAKPRQDTEPATTTDPTRHSRVESIGSNSCTRSLRTQQCAQHPPRPHRLLSTLQHPRTPRKEPETTAAVLTPDRDHDQTPC
jgi:hypothetical protein